MALIHALARVTHLPSHLVAILSALFTDLVERGIAAANPARNLPRSTMRLMRQAHDPRTTPFIERLSDIRRIYLALPETFHVAYAVGAGRPRPRCAPPHPHGMEAPGGRPRQVVPPLRRDGTKVDKHTPGEYLQEALERLSREWQRPADAHHVHVRRARVEGV